MKDIAAELGISTSTVSRVLTRPEMVNAKTRKAVLDAVERMQFRPNLTARDLRRQESRIVLVVVPRVSPFFLEVFRGVEEAGRESGYFVMMGHTDRDPVREQVFLDQVQSGRADGMILVTSADGDRLAARRGSMPPVVALLDAVDGLRMPTVRIDSVAGARSAVEYLISLGHRRIAHISGPLAMPMALHRREGFEEAIAAARLDRDLCHVTEGDFTLASGQVRMGQLLTRHPRPTAVFAANDEMAIGAMEAIAQAGLRVGDDISVIGFDDQRLARLYLPPLTTVHVPTEELGYRAMVELEKFMRGEQAEMDMVLPTHVVVRETTGAPKPD